MALEWVQLKRNDHPIKMKVKVGNAHFGSVSFTSHDRNNKILFEKENETDLSQMFHFADSAEQIDWGSITWVIDILDQTNNSNNPYNACVKILQGEDEVPNGCFPYSGNLNKGVKRIAETVMFEISD